MIAEKSLLESCLAQISRYYDEASSILSVLQTFYHGIPFLDRTEEGKVVQEMEQQSAAKAATPRTIFHL